MPIYIGTSGWTYPHWQKAFFPKNLPSVDRLHYYALRFNSVEVNTTFYGTPKKETVRAWSNAVPASFRFSIKASRFITHNKKLLEPRKSSIKLFRAIEPIAEQTTAVLFQLPPWFARDEERLRAFLRKMPSAYRYAFEFRHPTWFCEEVYDILRDAAAALCVWDLKGKLAPIETTTDWVYVRLHGPTSRAYRGSYPDASLRGWRDHGRKWKRAKMDALFYFDNDEKGYAPINALRLAEMLES
ncbi:MAG TPA: DUF72 domain-containing protein [Candidatus Methylacidiphilales bacterium]|nr:DUF72 domain-containing protein [Candidatus Methylacidiphilales bacterium]